MRLKKIREKNCLLQTNGLRNAVPMIAFKHNLPSVTVFWTKKSPVISEFVENYQVRKYFYMYKFDIFCKDYGGWRTIWRFNITTR